MEGGRARERASGKEEGGDGPLKRLAACCDVCGCLAPSRCVCVGLVRRGEVAGAGAGTGTGVLVALCWCAESELELESGLWVVVVTSLLLALLALCVRLLGVVLWNDALRRVDALGVSL